MTAIDETVTHVLVPHSRFVACREARLARVAAFTPHSASPSVEAEVLPAAIEAVACAAMFTPIVGER